MLHRVYTTPLRGTALGLDHQDRIVISGALFARVFQECFLKTKRSQECVFKNKKKMRTSCFNRSVFTFARRHQSVTVKQSETRSSRQSPRVSALIRRNSLVAQREIKKDNKPDTLISPPPEMQLYFERSD